ncbi:GNAT family N-acetyltransferase [Streptomyces sp. ET3-23]|uniref:GNAT family N-acetyltransferase n=1 Tax=Streptomyces sp. ET3-23 TaxID=2885643 RepID=UPI001D0F6653|nr:GNAT family N-acetyltransferase [Streptomyces sp. ET3-23]MCC2278555.1 GNAT family N-acetyltransferase [Streptomyces sp. ET3-23]
MDHTIRSVRADEWRQARELRLEALQDPAAPIAFLDTYDQAVARPDSHWQERTAGNAAGKDSIGFIAEGPDGAWVGSVTVLVELPGAEGLFGGSAPVPQAHIVGVYVRPEHRATGVSRALFEAALEWSWALTEPRVERVRLFVHEQNDRARAFYRKMGFEPTGLTVPLSEDPSQKEFELVVVRPRPAVRCSP